MITANAGLQEFRRESQGKFLLRFFDQDGALDLLRAGDIESLALMDCLNQVLDAIEVMSRPCLTCETMISAGCPPAVIAVAYTGRPDTPAIGMGICDNCFEAGPSAVQSSTLAALRQLWPSLKAQAIHPQEGHA